MANRFKDPLKAFRFLIKVEGNGNKEVSGAFMQCSGVKVDVQTIQARAGSDPRGVQEYIPVGTRYSPVTLTKGIVGDSDFLQWVFDSAARTSEGIKGDDLYRTLSIIALQDETGEDGQGKHGVTWILRNAVPIGYELHQMDSSRSEVLTESITFAYSGLQRIVAAEEAPPPSEK